MRRALLLATLSLLLCSRVHAGTGLDVDAWLSKPGVRLLAVEFYATWCKPCMAAVPRWKALHEKHRKDGLRLVVVAVRDPKGGCASLPWTPDDVICDDEGFLAERFGAESLPAAFLWSWQGEVLSHHAHVDAVEAAVARYLAEAPRVDVEVAEVAAKARIKKEALAALVRGKLSETRKVPVVASEAERRALRAQLKRALETGTDATGECEAGGELSANALLVARVTESGQRLRLSLALQSVERACQEAYTAVDFDAAEPAASVAEAVAELLGKLRGETRYPWATARVEAPGAPPPAAAEPAVPSTPAERWVKVKAYAALESVPVEERLAEAERFVAGLPADAAERPVAESLALALRPDRGLTWVRSRPAGVDFTRSEVTVVQYGACLAAGGCTEPARSEHCNWDRRAERVQHPLNCVDWNQAVAFCHWAGGRLPREEEWFAEASNRGSRTYPWGEEEPTCDRVVKADDRGDGCGLKSTWPVCSKPAGHSVSGLCDLSGNVWEWTATASGTSLMFRGGSWYGGKARFLTAQASGTNGPSERWYALGFRCVREPR